MQTHRAGKVGISFVLALRLSGILVVGALLCKEVLFPEILVGAVLVLDELHNGAQGVRMCYTRPDTNQACQRPLRMCSRRS